jgi:uncharacterized membrane protein
MKSVKPWLLLLLVFLAGAAVGVIGTRVVVRHVLKRVMANPDLVWTRIERALAADLKLNPEQRVKVRQVLSETQNQVRDLRIEFQPRFLSIVEKARTELAAALTPEQRARLDQLLQERERLWKPKSGSTNY